MKNDPPTDAPSGLRNAACSPSVSDDVLGGLCRHIRELERQIEMAVDILDGNAEVIDWHDQDEPELLRKLCEHLEAKCGRFYMDALAQPAQGGSTEGDK